MTSQYEIIGVFQLFNVESFIDEVISTRNVSLSSLTEYPAQSLNSEGREGFNSEPAFLGRPSILILNTNRLVSLAEDLRASKCRCK